MAKKVLPPREVTLIHLHTKQSYQAELYAVSRLAIGLTVRQEIPSGRYEIKLDNDFRIIGNTVSRLSDSLYQVVDIEKVLRKEGYSQRLTLEEFQAWQLSCELEPTVIISEPEEEEHRLLLKKELDKLAIIHHLQEIYMLMWECNQLRPLGDFVLMEPLEKELKRLVKQAMESDAPAREILLADKTKQIFDVHIIPFKKDVCGIGMINITDVIAKERERQRQEWDACNSLLKMFTNGKLALLQDHDLYSMLLKSEKFFSHAIQNPEDLKEVRKTLMKVLEPYNLSKTKILHYSVAVNEAATNTLRHSKGGYIDYYISEQEKVCRVVIYDEGEGIMLYELPKAALVQGYSTQNSLGAGFHAMLTFADRVLLNSSPQGTKVVMEIKI